MRLAVVATHPIQYQAPWFRHLAADGRLELKVFYLWDFGAATGYDPGFEQRIRWDVPLLDGYESTLIENRACKPGTHHFFGLINPGLSYAVHRFQPDAVLMMAYRYAALMQFLLTWTRENRTPLLFRGDSHRLARNNDITQPLRRRFVSTVFSRFRALLYVGQANRDYFRYHGVPDEKLFFSPHAVDYDRFQIQGTEASVQAETFRSQLGIPRHHAVILFLGKFRESKRPLDLLQAFEWAGLERASLVFVGEGALGDELRQRAKGIPHVHVVPFQNQSAVPGVLSAADLVVLPSKGAHESWGLVVNEAMSLSKGVIVSDETGCAADLVRSGENGFVFQAGNVSHLTDVLKAALRDRERLRQWGQRSRAIIEHYTYREASAGLYEALTATACLAEAASIQ